MTRTYSFRVFKNVPSPDGLQHVELGSYDNLLQPPWVPREGEFFRFRDPQPPGKPTDHRETAGTVRNVVTCFYGTNTTIEVYIEPRSKP